MFPLGSTDNTDPLNYIYPHTAQLKFAFNKATSTVSDPHFRSKYQVICIKGLIKAMSNILVNRMNHLPNFINESQFDLHTRYHSNEDATRQERPIHAT